MGLPISLSIIGGHGGRLWAETKVNEGSVFRSRCRAGAIRRHEGSDPIVFVIDDESLIRDGMRSLIRSVSLRDNSKLQMPIN